MANALLAQLAGSGMVPPGDTTFSLPAIKGSKLGVTETTTKKKKDEGEDHEDKKKELEASVGFCYLMAAACASLNGPTAADTSAAFWRDGARELRLEPTRREKWAQWADDAAEKQEFVAGHLRIKDRPEMHKMDADHKDFTIDQVRRYRKAVNWAERIRAPERAIALLPPSEQIGAHGGSAVPSSNPHQGPKTPAERLKELELLDGNDGDDDDNRGGRSGGRKKGFWKDDKKDKKKKEATKDSKKNKKKRAGKKGDDAPSPGSSKKKQKENKRRK